MNIFDEEKIEQARPSIIPACFVKLRVQVSFLLDGVVLQVPLQGFMCVVDQVESYEVDEDNPCDH